MVTFCDAAISRTSNALFNCQVLTNDCESVYFQSTTFPQQLSLSHTSGRLVIKTKEAT